MRAWIPLDLRNIDKTEALRNQLRRLNDFLSDLAASLAPSSLVPQQPDSLTIFNDFIQNLNLSGGDAKNLIFFDDFLYDPQADPAPSASGVWRTGNQAGSGTWQTYEAETDQSAFGVHRFASNATVGDTISIHMWARNVPTKPFALIPGLEIGFRVRRDASDFTQAQFTVSFGDGFSLRDLQRHERLGRHDPDRRLRHDPFADADQVRDLHHRPNHHVQEREADRHRRT
jgi:hypothetical protein